MAEQNTARRRRSSSILQVYHEPPEPVEQLSDRAALPNGNANWVNAKGEDLYLYSDALSLRHSGLPRPVARPPFLSGHAMLLVPED